MKSMRRVLHLLAGILLFLEMVSCSRQAERRYDLSGKVMAVDRAAHQLTIQHEDIAGLMPGMTMPFRVEDEWVYQAAGPGDSVTATLVIRGNRSHLENVVITKNAGPPPDIP